MNDAKFLLLSSDGGEMNWVAVVVEDEVRFTMEDWRETHPDESVFAVRLSDFLLAE